MRTNLRRTLAGGVVLAIGITPAAISAGPAMAAPAAPARTAESTAAPANYDARHDPAVTGMLGTRAAMLAARPPASVGGMRSELGDQGIVELDPLTGTPRQVARLDGFLTGPSGK